MASFESYRTKDGDRRYLATVRIKGFRRTSKSFSSKRDAEEWAGQTEKALREQRDRGGARADVGTLTVRQLVEAFLADPATKQRRYHPELEFLLGAWADDFGTVKAKEFGRNAIDRLSQFVDQQRPVPGAGEPLSLGHAASLALGPGEWLHPARS